MVAARSGRALPGARTMCSPTPKIRAARKADFPAAKSWPSSAAPPACPTATNMIATDWRQLRPRHPTARRRYSAGRSALLDHARLRARGPVVPRVGTDVGFALQQSLRRFAGHVHARGRGGARQDHRHRYALDLAGRPASHAKSRSASKAAGSPCRETPGLGIELDMAEVEKAHALYQEHGTRAPATTRRPCST